MSIADNIKRLRELYDLSQKDFGKIAGVSDKAVSTWERGDKIPRMGGAIQKIADHFNLEKSNIIDENGLKKLNAFGGKRNIEILDEKGKPIVFDPETWKIINAVRTRPEMRMLFSVSTDATPDDIIKTVKIIEALKNNGDGK